MPPTADAARPIGPETYRGLPPLAGLGSLEDAAKPGLTVEACVERIKRTHFALRRLYQIFTARITAEPIYELKVTFSHHAYLCAEHVAAFAKRVSELREPPLGLEVVPDTNLELFFDEILAAPTTGALLVGLYEAAVPAVIEGLNRHIGDANPLLDAPTVRLCKLARFELEEVAAFGRRAVEALVDEPARVTLGDWPALLNAALDAAGGLAGDPNDAKHPERLYSARPYLYDSMPRRDERFTDPYNAGVNPEAFLYDPAQPARAKTLMMLYKRLREIDVPEMMASIIHETPGQPWGYYLEMSRQLWDEARHALMGQVGFVALGLDWTQIPINFTWSRNLNTQLTPIERHAVLFFIEQGLMPKTGKRFEWEVGRASGNPLAAAIQDYDWADEVLHSQIGRRWYVPRMGGLNEALAYGDGCWTKVVSDWRGYLDSGLTTHRNWWPDLYRAACLRWQIDPEPDVLNFDQSYETIRADLKPLAASG